MYLNALRSQRILDTDSHVVPDLTAKSSSPDSSIASHWGHRIKSIAPWGNKIDFWGKHFKTIAQWGEVYFNEITYYGVKHWSTHCIFLLHCYCMTRRICGIKQVIIVALHFIIVVYTLPSLAITSFLHFSYWGITFTQCATKCPGINCYCKHQSSSLLLLPLFLYLTWHRFLVPCGQLCTLSFAAAEDI